MSFLSHIIKEKFDESYYKLFAIHLHFKCKIQRVRKLQFPKQYQT